MIQNSHAHWKKNSDEKLRMTVPRIWICSANENSDQLINTDDQVIIERNSAMAVGARQSQRDSANQEQRKPVLTLRRLHSISFGSRLY